MAYFRSRWIRITAVCAALALGLSSAQAQEHVGAAWQSVSVKKTLPHGLSATLRGEYRCKDNLRSDDLWFIRLTTGYKVNAHFSAALSYDYSNVSQGQTQKEQLTILPWTRHSHRLLADISGKHSWQAWTLSLRERYVWAHVPATQLGAYDNDLRYTSTLQPSSQSQLLRSLCTFTYRMANTPLAPYIAMEAYNGLGTSALLPLQQCHLFAGTSIRLDAVSSLVVSYVCQVKKPSDKHLHTLALDYVITLP